MLALNFDGFLNYFFGEISKDDFYSSQSLTNYLNRPSNERSGDEANIVDDKISRVLIEALGYSTGETDYNQAGAGGKRPDFKVAIPQYPRPCFIIEDKNTATEKLEPHLTQLEGCSNPTIPISRSSQERADNARFTPRLSSCSFI